MVPLGLTTSQFVTAPKPYLVAVAELDRLTTSQFVTAPKPAHPELPQLHV